MSKVKSINDVFFSIGLAFTIIGIAVIVVGLIETPNDYEIIVLGIVSLCMGIATLIASFKTHDEKMHDRAGKTNTVFFYGGLIYLIGAAAFIVVSSMEQPIKIETVIGLFLLLLGIWSIQQGFGKEK